MKVPKQHSTNSSPASFMPIFGTTDKMRILYARFFTITNSLALFSGDQHFHQKALRHVTLCRQRAYNGRNCDQIHILKVGISLNRMPRLTGMSRQQHFSFQQIKIPVLYDKRSGKKNTFKIFVGIDLIWMSQRLADDMQNCITSQCPTPGSNSKHDTNSPYEHVIRAGWLKHVMLGE